MSLKGEFQKTQASKDFAAMYGTMAFEEACKTAVLIHAAQLAPVTNDPQAAAANAFRLSGAQQLLEAFKSLTILETPSKPKPVGNLRHDLK